MATTPLRGLPYPAPGDSIVDYPATAASMAAKLDAEVLYGGKTNADTPSTYPVGTSLLTLTVAEATAGGWPDAASATVLTALRYDTGTPGIGFQIWSKTGTVPDLRVRSSTGNAWGAWRVLASDAGWTTFSSSVTGTSRYRVIDGIAYVQVEGSVNTSSGVELVLSTAPLPAGVRPLGAVARAGAIFSNYAGTLYVDTSGNVKAMQSSGGARTSVGGTVIYPVT